MKLRMSAIVFCMPYAVGLFAQSTTASRKSFSFDKGLVTVEQVSSAVIKLSYQPKGYQANELVSDAVLPLPVYKPIKPLPIEKQGDAIIIDQKLTIQPKAVTDGFGGFIIQLKPGEQIFGGGERALPLNRRGYKLELYNAPWYGYGEGADRLNYSVPFFTSSLGYGLLFDNPSKSYVDIGKTNSAFLEYGASGGALVVYIMLGNSHQQVLDSYYQLTGTQPLPPRWALGNLMSRFGYTSEREVDSIYAQMKASKIPVDAIIFDLFWFGDSIKNGLGNLNWMNKTHWPNPQAMMARFKRDRVNTILVTEPFFVKNTFTFNDALPHLSIDSAGKPYIIEDFYFGKAGLIDIFKPSAQNWFWQQYKKQMDMGVEGWWGDLGEPEMHPSKLYHNLQSYGYKRPFAADEVHNLYGHTWTKMLFQHYATDYPNKRLFSLNRSGFAGTQRYSIFPWTGDVSRSWGGLKAQLPVLLGMSMSGIPYVHSDAGGFAGGEGDNELYVRWLQMAAYTPIFRPHGTALYSIDPAAFSFPSEPALFAEPYQSLAKKVVNERYRMLAYNYTLAYDQAVNRKPLMRPLYYEHPSDTAASAVSDEFYWGSQLIIAPVLNKGATQRSVYLPKGEWYELNALQKIQGGNRFNQAVTLEAIPVYAKAGTILPLYENADGNNTSAINNQALTLAYFPATQKSAYTLYLDDGVSKNAISAHQYELIHIVAQPLPTGKGFQFTIQSNNGQYNGKPKTMDLKLDIMNGASPFGTSVTINGATQPPAKEKNDKKTVSLTFSGKPLVVVVK